MQCLILTTIFAILIFLIASYYIKQRKKKNIERIREEWGKPKTDSFYFENIRRYADTVKENPFHRLTKQTVEDIDFYGLFAFIDRTTSKIGQQFLFKKVIEPKNDTCYKSEELIDLFSKNQELREEIQLELLKLNNDDAYYIPSLLKDELLKKPKWFSLLIIDIVIVICLVMLSFKYPVFLIFLLVPMIVNMVLHYWNKGNTSQYSKSFTHLNILIEVSGKLISKGDFPFGLPVKASILNLKSFQRKTSLIYTDQGNGVQSELTQLVHYFIDYIKALFLIEVFTLYSVLKELENKKSSIIALFNYVGNIDTVISVASLRAGSLKTCKPIFMPERKEIIMKKIYHPLIEDCVKNDLTISGKSILITGSNMSGKSSFLRTFTINSILAQTIHTCFADEYISPSVKQFSSIRIDDNLFEGKSYYFQEVDTIGSLIKEAQLTGQKLFVLDEVFKGTNTIERIAAAKSILSYLNQSNNIVIVSTHDIELAGMLEQEYDLYHFTETVENNELHFDHTIKSGQLKTRNAIKILELSEYPEEIIAEAREISLALGMVWKV
jgi:hypothetical protein